MKQHVHIYRPVCAQVQHRVYHYLKTIQQEHLHISASSQGSGMNHSEINQGGYRAPVITYSSRSPSTRTTTLSSVTHQLTLIQHHIRLYKPFSGSLRDLQALCSVNKWKKLKAPSLYRYNRQEELFSFFPTIIKFLE